MVNNCSGSCSGNDNCSQANVFICFLVLLAIIYRMIFNQTLERGTNQLDAHPDRELVSSICDESVLCCSRCHWPITWSWAEPWVAMMIFFVSLKWAERQLGGLCSGLCGDLIFPVGCNEPSGHYTMVDQGSWRLVGVHTFWITASLLPKNDRTIHSRFPTKPGFMGSITFWVGFLVSYFPSDHPKILV